MITLHHGDCLDVLRTLGDDSVDAVVTDPPAGIAFMGKEWDHDKGGRREWIGWLSQSLAECLRVAKPGSVLLCWAIPRTSHWTGTAIEDAGWQIQDRLAHVFGSGFPKHKSHLKPAVEDWWLARKPGPKWLGVEACRVETAEQLGRLNHTTSRYIDSANGSREPHARTVWVDNSTGKGRWPANLLLSHSPLCVCRGTKRVKGSHQKGKPWQQNPAEVYSGSWAGVECKGHVDAEGMETVADYECHESCPIRLMGEQGGERRPGERPARCAGKNGSGGTMNPGWQGWEGRGRTVLDSGTAARFFPNFRPDDHDPFFYCPKASRKDRGEGNNHPTVKNTELMRWLCRLACPPGGVILDPFMGSGSTGRGAVLEGFGFIGIEREEEYHRIAEARIASAVNDTPLFTGAAV